MTVSGEPGVPRELIKILSKASSIVVLTGSGISAESGVPTFREAQTGLWEKYDPMELATPQAFQNNPKLVWQWYSWRRQLVSQATPNPAHLALVEMQSLFPKFTLITQNVDGLHQRAGSDPVVELHGNILRTKCSIENTIVDNWLGEGHEPPLCPKCGGLLRPDVVWFGESLPEAALAEAIHSTQNCDLFFSIGTSAIVQPAASLPIQALKFGAAVVEINIDQTPLTTQATFFIRGPAGMVLPVILSTASITKHS
ncbi:MAG TPA: NAD-dependent protein deacylase [Chloroflexi bacterium]|nr:NAD-dependent protein deacylase [Chloroflexota bacterium]